VHTHGCTAIAVVVRFPEDDDTEEGEEEEDGSASSTVLASSSMGEGEQRLTAAAQKKMFQAYRAGEGVDAVAGVEALISHVIGSALLVPCAHAPAFAPTPADPGVSPKAAAEELGYTFLPCVLAYLHRAPNLVPIDSGGSVGSGSTGSGSTGGIVADDVDAVVVPYDALGGVAVLEMLARGTLVVAVRENLTSMDVTPAALQLLPPEAPSGSSNRSSRNIVVARSYCEAAGLLAAHRAGILFDSLTPAVPHIPVTTL
jgi:hypothetical protein